MKVARTYTIDHNLVERMQNLNASELINTLLKEYFELRSDKNTLRDEKKAVLDSILKKKSNFLKNLRSLLSGSHLKSKDLRGDGLLHGERNSIFMKTPKNILNRTILMLKKGSSSTEDTEKYSNE